MTLGALILAERIFAPGISTRLKYATLGVLFVNVSIGGTLTPFAAPPVLMVAAKWQWDTAFMLTTIGWKAAVAVAVNAFGAALLFRAELARLAPAKPAAGRAGRAAAAGAGAPGLPRRRGAVRPSPRGVHGLFLFFLGVVHAYARHQDRLMLREGLMVAFFLAGLVVLGGQQQWWLQAALTAVTDNAALTYLGSLVEGLSDEFKVALVTGAVTGGGLTVIANAPNPAGMAILRGHFDAGAVKSAGPVPGRAGADAGGGAGVPFAVGRLARRAARWHHGGSEH